MTKMIKQKVQRIFDDVEVKTIWTYDYSISKSNPINVEIFYKNEPKVVVKRKKSS